MEINFKFYNEKNNDDNLSKIDQEICAYIKQNPKEEYSEIVEKDGRLKVLQVLDSIRKNIINWYPFRENSNILEINGDFGEITEELSEQAQKLITIEKSKQKAETIKTRLNEKNNVTIIVGKIKDIDLNIIEENIKFDYVLINGVEEKEELLEDYLEFIKKYIKEDGIILFTADNKFGLKTYNINFEEPEEGKHYISKSKIEEILPQYGLNNYKFYYPLPNYKTPNVIFTDKHMPNRESILRDLTLYNKEDILVFDERQRYKEIIKEQKELFKFFANSFLVEIKNNEDDKDNKNDIEFISFGNSRKEKYRMKTVMLQDVVYKQNVSNIGKEHLNRIKNNIDILNNSNINILDSYDDNKIYSRLIREENAKSLDKILIEMFDKGNKDEFYNLIEKFYKELSDKLIRKENNEEQTVFEKYNIAISEQANNKLQYVEKGMYDLIFQNCFYIDDKFYFYDQEWEENNLPIEFIIYRAINYLANSKKEIDRNKIYERFQINEYIETFEELEQKLQKEIKNEFIWKMHAENHTTVQNVYDTQVHYRNLKNLAENELENERKLKEGKEAEITIRDKQIENLSTQINYMKNSKSWKFTRIFRRIKTNINKGDKKG